MWFIIMLIYIVPSVSAVENLGGAIDCSNMEIHYTDNPEWTRSEKIDAMNNAFFESLDRFELCNLSNKSSASSAFVADEVGQTLNSNDGVEESFVANRALAETKTTADDLSNDAASSATTSQKPTEQSTDGINSNGGKPEDMPNADNDDVIAAQIRRAAEIEQNPIKKEKLWNEYRKYRALP